MNPRTQKPISSSKRSSSCSSQPPSANAPARPKHSIPETRSTSSRSAQHVKSKNHKAWIPSTSSASSAVRTGEPVPIEESKMYKDMVATVEWHVKQALDKPEKMGHKSADQVQRRQPSKPSRQQFAIPAVTSSDRNVKKNQRFFPAKQRPSRPSHSTYCREDYPAGTSPVRRSKTKEQYTLSSYVALTSHSQFREQSKDMYESNTSVQVQVGNQASLTCGDRGTAASVDNPLAQPNRPLLSPIEFCTMLYNAPISLQLTTSDQLPHGERHRRAAKKRQKRQYTSQQDDASEAEDWRVAADSRYLSQPLSRENTEEPMSTSPVPRTSKLRFDSGDMKTYHHQLGDFSDTDESDVYFETSSSEESSFDMSSPPCKPPAEQQSSPNHEVHCFHTAIILAACLALTGQQSV